MSSSCPNLPGQEGMQAPWLAHYPECVPATLDYPQQPLWWLLEEAARNFPDRVACHYYRQQVKYSELFDAARRTAETLVRLGMKPGDRVGLLLPNVPEYLAAAYGIWMAGGVVVSLNPLMVPSEISDLVAATDCRIVIALDVLFPLACDGEKRPDQTLLVTIKDRLPRWQRFGYGLVRWKRLGLRPVAKNSTMHWFADELKKSDGRFEPVWASGDTPAYILPTGGTTGSPKAVVLTHANLMANAWQLIHWTDKHIGEETLLAVVPFFHSYGLSTCATTGVASAATIVLHHRFKPELVLKLIERHRPICFPTVPAMLSAMNECMRRRPYDVTSLQYVISGGAPLDLAIAEEFAEYTGATVVEGYGLSEASPVTHTGPLDGTARPGTIGLPMPDTEARIVDAETGSRTLPPGEVVELESLYEKTHSIEAN